MKGTKNTKDYSFRPHSISVALATGEIFCLARWLAEVHKDPAPVLVNSRVRSQASIALRTLAVLGVHPGALGFVSLHRCGVAHQPSLRSRRTMTTYANSLSKPACQTCQFKGP